MSDASALDISIVQEGVRPRRWHRLRNWLVAILLVLVVLAVGGVWLNRAANAAKIEAEGVARAYLAAVSDADNERALEFCAPELLAGTPRETMLTLMQGSMNKLGRLRTASLRTWNVRERAATNLPGTHVVLLFDTVHANGSARETITLYRRPGGSMQVLGHNLQSEVFIQ